MDRFRNFAPVLTKTWLSYSQLRYEVSMNAVNQIVSELLLFCFINLEFAWECTDVFFKRAEWLLSDGFLWSLTETGSRGLGERVCCSLLWCAEYSLHSPAVSVHTDVWSSRSQKHCGQTAAARVSVHWCSCFSVLEKHFVIICSPPYSFIVSTLEEDQFTLLFSFSCSKPLSIFLTFCAFLHDLHVQCWLDHAVYCSFITDENTWSIDRQFLWGLALLITPALDQV